MTPNGDWWGRYGLEFQRYWYQRKSEADFNREPLYVTPEEYQDLLAYAAHEQEERDRRYGPELSRVPAPDEPRTLYDAYFGTQVVIDRAERDAQVGVSHIASSGAP